MHEFVLTAILNLWSTIGYHCYPNKQTTRQNNRNKQSANSTKKAGAYINNNKRNQLP